MKILAIETSTTLGGVSLMVNGEIKKSYSSKRQKSHSDIIHQYIEQLLSEESISLSDIDYLSVGIGPGSFTGIRVAVNTIKTYSYSLGTPIIVTDSLETLAYQAFLENPKVQATGKITVMMNAFKNMVYFGQFEFANSLPKYIQSPRAIPVKQLQDQLKDESNLVIGDGYTVYKTYIEKNFPNKFLHLSEIEQFPHPSSVAKLSFQKIKNNVQTYDWKSFTPLYLRASEAEENKQGILLIPLT